jgi:hypothetical protein
MCLVGDKVGLSIGAVFGTQRERVKKQLTGGRHAVQRIVHPHRPAFRPVPASHARPVGTSRSRDRARSIGSAFPLWFPACEWRSRVACPAFASRCLRVASCPQSFHRASVALCSVALCCVRVAIVPQSSPWPCGASIETGRLGEQEYAYRPAARSLRAGPAKAAAAMSSVAKASSWCALRDAVGAVMSTLMPPIAVSAQGPSLGPSREVRCKE